MKANGQEQPVFSDADARGFAADFRNNVVLEASAGTGKTSVLVERYINLLRAGVDPSHILAITFTRKAASEMRGRIVDELRVAASRSDVDATRWRKLRRRLGEISISTIDAFCLSLLREFPLEADIDPGFTMADEVEIPRLMKHALDRTLKICSDLVPQDDDIAMVLDQLGSVRARDGLAELLRRRLVTPWALHQFLVSGPFNLTGEDICRQSLSRLRDILETAPNGLEKFFNDGPVGHPRFRILRADLQQLTDIQQVNSSTARGIIERIRDHFLTQKGQPRNRIQAYSRIHYSGSGALKNHHDAVISVGPAVRDAIIHFDRNLNFVLVRGVRRMFNIALSEYKRSLDSRAILDFSEVLERALHLLRQMDEFAQSRYRLESRYHHILMDEFQDTSRAQWELVSLLMQSWGEGFGLVHDAPVQPSIFIVGDPKQSIYQFRDAEVKLLRQAGKHIEHLRSTGNVRRSISHSFRATPKLLKFINDLFTAVDKVPIRDDAFTYDLSDRFPLDHLDKDQVGFQQTHQTARPDHLTLGMAVGDSFKQCAEAVASEIERLRENEVVRDRDTGVIRQINAGDIAILFRSRGSHTEIERALEVRKIPTHIYKGLGFFDADEIKDFYAIIRFLAEPESELKAAAFLRSRFVRLSDEALCKLSPELSAVITDPKPLQKFDLLGLEDQRVITCLRSCARRWFSLVDRITPAELIDRVLSDSAYAYELRGSREVQGRENLKKIRSLVRRIQNRGYATLSRIAEYLDQLSVDESNAVVDAVQAVNLMTVHSAKGLEFPVVFLVDLSRGTSNVPQPIRVSLDRGDGNPSVTVGSFRSATDTEDQKKEFEETKRLLYVAATRARDRFYMSAVMSKGEVKMGRGSLAEVLPKSLLPVFLAAGCANGSEAVVRWVGPSGNPHDFGVCRPKGTYTRQGCAKNLPLPVTKSVTMGGRVALSRPTSDVKDGRLTVTGWIETSANHLDPDRSHQSHHASNLIFGTLVHRLLPFLHAGVTAREEIKHYATRLLRTDEKVATDNCDALVSRVVNAYLSILDQSDIMSIMRDPCLFEMPFSLKLEGSSDGQMESVAGTKSILRGTIDCLVKRSNGSLTVVEFKTGSPQLEHRTQLDLYVLAIRELFPEIAVEGVLVYIGDDSPHIETVS